MIEEIKNFLVDLQKKDVLKKVLKNSGWLFFDNFYRLFGSLFIFALVARYLGPSEFGLLNYSIAFSTIFTSLSSFGLDGVVVKMLSQKKYDENIILGNSFILRIIGSLISIFLVFISISYIKPYDHNLVLMAVIVSVSYLVSSFYVIDWWFQSKVNSKYVVISKCIAFTVLSVLKIVLVLNSAKVIWFAITILLETCITVISLLYFFLKINNWKISWKVDNYILKILAKSGLPLIASGLFVYIQSYIDQIMLGTLVNSYEVGQYSVAMRITNVFDFIPMILFSSLLPIVSKYKEENENKYLWIIMKIYQLMLIIFIAIFVPIVVLSKPFILLMYGESYIKSAYIMSLLGFRFLFTVLGVTRSMYILSDNKYKYTMVTSLIGVIINVLMNMVLIPRIGSYGSVLSSVISLMFSIVVIDYINKDTRKYVKMLIKSIIKIKSFGDFSIKDYFKYDGSEN